MIKRNKNIARGFSLIEVLVAIVVLGAGLLGLAKLQGITLLNSAESRMYTHGLNLAQEKIETLRSYANTSVHSNDYPDEPVSETFDGANASFTRTWTISDCLTAECKIIKVDVTWTGVDGNGQTITLSSQIATLEPARSGMVVASVATVGDTAAESAAKAAAHAAAAATYEAQVAASSAATATQKAEAAAAKARAEQAAQDAQDAADTGDAAEAALQAEIAATAAAEILAILQTLPGISYTINGATPAATTSLTVEDGTCVFGSGAYTCTVSTHESEVTITGSNGTVTQACVVTLTPSPVTGCTIVFSNDCTKSWTDAASETVTDGSQVTAYQLASSTTCPSEIQQCTTGTLSPSNFNYKSCTIVCTVPDYIGDKINCPSEWNSTGPGSVTCNFSGKKTIATQSLTAGSSQSCTSTLVLDD